MNQNKRSNKSNYGYYTALVVGVLAFAALVGVYTYRQNKSDASQYVDLNEKDDSKETGGGVKKSTNSDLSDADGTDTDRIGKADLAMGTDGSTTQSTTEEKSLQNSETSKVTSEETTTEKKEDVTEETTAVTAGFTEKASLIWPVQGKVVMPYSMDTTVYYKTIDAYKCSPGMIIQSKKGTNVKSAYKGTVTEITNSNEYGKMVKVDIGNGYTLTYGQLSDVAVNVGDAVNQGDVIATIAKPTEMFTMEGANLYLHMEKDNKGVNPGKYLK